MPNVGWLARDLDAATAVTVFLSSGSDVVGLRDEFDAMVREVNSALTWSSNSLTVRLQRWEDSPPRRADGDPNALFRELAASAHLTVVLLNNEIRPGTREELEAALQVPDVQIAVIWTGNPTSSSGSDLERYLETKKDLLIWKKTEAPGTSGCSRTLFGVLARLLIESLTMTPIERHYEEP